MKYQHQTVPPTTPPQSKLLNSPSVPQSSYNLLVFPSSRHLLAAPSSPISSIQRSSRQIIARASRLRTLPNKSASSTTPLPTPHPITHPITNPPNPITIPTNLPHVTRSSIPIRSRWARIRLWSRSRIGVIATPIRIIRITPRVRSRARVWVVAAAVGIVGVAPWVWTRAGAWVRVVAAAVGVVGVAGLGVGTVGLAAPLVSGMGLSAGVGLVELIGLVRVCDLLGLADLVGSFFEGSQLRNVNREN